MKAKSKAPKPEKPKKRRLTTKNVPEAVADHMGKAPAIIAHVDAEQEVIPQPSGAAKLKAAGKRAIMVAVTEEEYAALEWAAKSDSRPLSTWMRVTCLRVSRTMATQ